MNKFKILHCKHCNHGYEGIYTQCPSCKKPLVATKVYSWSIPVTKPLSTSKE